MIWALVYSITQLGILIMASIALGNAGWYRSHQRFIQAALTLSKADPSVNLGLVVQLLDMADLEKPWFVRTGDWIIKHLPKRFGLSYVK